MQVSSVASFHVIVMLNTITSVSVFRFVSMSTFHFSFKKIFIVKQVSKGKMKML